jgi:dephospho-CoA kinase
MSIDTLLALVGFAVIAAGAVVMLRAQIVKTNHEELERLASTRGETIDDLEKQLVALRKQVAALEAKVDALEALKASELADAVEDRLRPIIEKGRP